MKDGKCGCCPVTCVAKILLIVGGLNWGLVGVADYNLVTELFGAWPTVISVIYILVGIAALWMIVKMFMMMGKK